MIENSLRNYGAGRSILIDKDGAIIVGNKTLENAGGIGLEDVIVVRTDGTSWSPYLDLAKDERAKALAIADNRAGQVVAGVGSGGFNRALRRTGHGPVLHGRGIRQANSCPLGTELVVTRTTRQNCHRKPPRATATYT